LKAIKLTKGNTSQLLSQFENLDEDFLKDSNGYWLLSEFGEDAVFQGVVSDTTFKNGYAILGTLKHGWVEVIENA
jgi:hypothetical protein